MGPGRGFGTDHNEVTVLDSRGQEVVTASGSKDEVAHAVLDAVSRLLDTRR